MNLVNYFIADISRRLLLRSRVSKFSGRFSRRTVNLSGRMEFWCRLKDFVLRDYSFLRDFEKT